MSKTIHVYHQLMNNHLVTIIVYYMYTPVFSCMLVIKEKKKENPDPIHHTQTVQTHKHKMTRTPVCPAFKTGMVG